MRVKFWGTRGSIPTPGPETVIYGGNTSCVEVGVAGGGRIVLDAGSGIRKLGLSLASETKLEAALLLTHVHWDHIQGFPFFAPLYKDSTTIDIYGGEVAHRKVERLLSDQMEQVYFPIDLRSLRATMRFHDFDTQGFECNGARVSLLRVNHTTETVGFRIEDDSGGSVVYIPDNELARCTEKGATPYAEFVRFCAGVELLIHDAQYTTATYARFRGWGHSTFEEALNLAIDAGAKRVALFHHDPATTDMELERRGAWSVEHLRGRGLPLEVECAREEVEHMLGGSAAASLAPQPASAAARASG